MDTPNLLSMLSKKYSEKNCLEEKSSTQSARSIEHINIPKRKLSDNDK